MILGATQDDAHDYVVVLCDHKSLKAVRRVFDRERVIRDLLDSSDNDKCSFKVILEGSPPRLRALLSTVWVEIAEAGYEAFPGTGETLCGQPLRLINPVNDIRYTTFGGVIKVVDKSNEATFYGMTAGHGISSLEPEDFAISKMMDCWGSSETEAETEPETESSDNDESGFSRHVPSIVDHKRWQRLGMAFTGRSQSNKYSDWALHELRHGSLLPNMICTRETKGKIRKRPLSTKVGMVTAESSKILVELIGGHKGSRNGVLWNQPAGLLVGPDMLPVDAYMVTLNKGSISDGDSGSWVVGSRSLEPYGHVIADDVFWRYLHGSIEYCHGEYPGVSTSQSGSFAIEQRNVVIESDAESQVDFVQKLSSRPEGFV
ncbi:hypothetical protein K456DRAFT_1718647 [Colletotrichum gloeosporioides 23]|nr:hypothetical protein K456DRAFT_1718647 [Colletotrichum gloeosporioides 23]